MADHDNLIRAPAGFAHAALIGLADVDPQLDRAGEVFHPDVGLVHVEQTLGQGDALLRIQRVEQHPHHHALLGLGGVAGQGQGMVGVVMPVHVGHLQVGFVNRCFQRHSLNSQSSRVPPDLPRSRQPPEGDKKTWGGPAFSHEDDIVLAGYRSASTTTASARDDWRRLA